jgi:hypothetical protein
MYTLSLHDALPIFPLPEENEFFLLPLERGDKRGILMAN